MLYSCYLRQDAVYVPTVGKRGGSYAEIEPVSVVSVTNTEGLRHAFVDAIGRKNVAVSPQKGKQSPPVLPKYAGVKSWSSFARGTSTWSIKEKDEHYEIVGYRIHAKGYWEEDPEQRTNFPPGATVDDVINRMIAILQDAARLARSSH